MMTKMLLLAALMLCCCIHSLNASPKVGCYCIRPTPTPIHPLFIRKIEVIPISGQCRRLQIIVVRRRGSKICIDPNAPWIQKMLEDLQRKAANSTAVPQFTSALN